MRYLKISISFLLAILMVPVIVTTINNTNKYGFDVTFNIGASVYPDTIDIDNLYDLIYDSGVKDVAIGGVFIEYKDYILINNDIVYNDVILKISSDNTITILQGTIEEGTYQYIQINPDNTIKYTNLRAWDSDYSFRLIAPNYYDNTLISILIILIPLIFTAGLVWYFYKKFE